MAWYEDPEQYVWDSHLPIEFKDNAGPHGVALVDVYAEGRTTPGWGLLPTMKKSGDMDPGFMANYAKRKFWDRPRLIDFDKRKQPFAIVMRSVNIICVDIDRHLGDGGADGFKAAAKLDLPETLAETSKSGEGRHLFYRTDELWDDIVGFGKYDDVIGLAPGVDIRAVGCVYHHQAQRWSHTNLAPLPDELRQMLEVRRIQRQNKQDMLTAAAVDTDSEEALIMWDSLQTELDKPIAPGKRNNTLFALGQQMKTAGFPDWEAAIEKRAGEVGLDPTETDKLIANISRY